MTSSDEIRAAPIRQRQFERGAMLVIPKQHRESVLDIEPREIEGVYRLVRDVAHAAAKALGADGMSIYQNNGAKANQHEPHFHVHVVPRFKDSDPHRIFVEQDCEVTSMEEQRAIAGLIRSAL